MSLTCDLCQQNQRERWVAVFVDGTRGRMVDACGPCLQPLRRGRMDQCVGCGGDPDGRRDVEIRIADAREPKNALCWDCYRERVASRDEDRTLFAAPGKRRTEEATPAFASD